MKLENQVTSLEPSKKLKELGVKQESLWWWCIYTDKWFLAYREDGIADTNNQVSAFTVAELGEILPKDLHLDTPKQCRLYMNGVHRCVYLDKNYEWVYTTVSPDNNEADARVKMLIYLIENKLIEAK